MMEKNFSKGLVLFGCVKIVQIDAGIRESLISWSEHREWSVPLKCFEQAGLDHRTHQRMVLAAAGRRSRHVVGEVGWCQHLVDDVITPLLVLTSAEVTVASLTITLLPTANDSGCPLRASVVMQSESAVDGTFPATTWY